MERLQKAGALIIGKTNLDEFTYGSSSEPSAVLEAAPQQPLEYTARYRRFVRRLGGVGRRARGTARLARIPAAPSANPLPCKVVGLKPTYGAPPTWSDSLRLIAGLPWPAGLRRPGRGSDAAGFAGTDQVPTALARSRRYSDYLAALQEGVRGLRIGLSRDYDHISYPDTLTGEMSVQAIQPEMNSAVRDVAEALARLGAEIVEDVPMPNARHGIPAYFVISRVEAASNLHRLTASRWLPASLLPCAG